MRFPFPRTSTKDGLRENPEMDLERVWRGRCRAYIICPQKPRHCSNKPANKTKAKKNTGERSSLTDWGRGCWFVVVVVVVVVVDDDVVVYFGTGDDDDDDDNEDDDANDDDDDDDDDDGDEDDLVLIELKYYYLLKTLMKTTFLFGRT